jgi:hypothetical protein
MKPNLLWQAVASARGMIEAPIVRKLFEEATVIVGA